METVTNIKIAGLGGMGILKSSFILAEVLFRCGHDVKKAEVHGMSQRGGSVASDIRFGKTVLSPMIPEGETDYLLLLAPREFELYRDALRPDGRLLSSSTFDTVKLPHSRSLNIGMLGLLSRHLTVPLPLWQSVIREALPAQLHEVNLRAFDVGRNVES